MKQSDKNFYRNMLAGNWPAILDPTQTWVPPVVEDVYPMFLEMVGLPDDRRVKAEYDAWARKLYRHWLNYRGTVDGVEAHVLLYRTGIIKESLGI
jgi:hypothetical protein